MINITVILLMALQLAVWGVGAYIAYLLITALRIYINKNRD